MFKIDMDAPKGKCSLITAGPVQDVFAELTMIVSMVLARFPEDFREFALNQITSREYWDFAMESEKECREQNGVKLTDLSDLSLTDLLELAKQKTSSDEDDDKAVSIDGMDFTSKDDGKEAE